MTAPVKTAIHKTPRSLWLGLSLLVFLFGSLAWWMGPPWSSVNPAHASAQAWWNRPWTRVSDASLPEISARLFAIDTEPFRAGNHPPRLWIAGARGFLAFSEDEGKCWVRYDYFAQEGEFRPGDNPCKMEIEASSPPPKVASLFPIAFQDSQQQQRSPQQQQLLPSAVPEKGGSGFVSVEPESYNYGDVLKGRTARREFLVYNGSGAPFRVLNVALRGSGGEFEVTNGCGSDLPVGVKCPVFVSFTPKFNGAKQVTLSLTTTWHPSPLMVSIMANAVNELPPAATRPPVAPPRVPPRDAPDLLAMSQTPEARMLSTGGWTWSLLRPQLVWKIQEVPSGTLEAYDDLIWRVGQIRSGEWVTESPHDDLAKLELDKARYRCTDCTMRAEIADTAMGVSWAAGWSTDSNGEHAIVLRSQDKGSNWTAVTQGALSPELRDAAAAGRVWMWPPVWYWGVLALSSVLAGIAFLRPPDIEPSHPADTRTENIEGRLSSDKPLGPGDLDVLGLTSIALGLSRFLRNQKTLPPLTVAINGEWGSGKSSLMNLLKGDLESYGMRPVWFNAWHHQKEEHLLAALLQTVRLEAVPPIWNLLGMPFRMRLLWSRFRRQWPMVVFLAAIATFLLIIDISVRKEAKADFIVWLFGQFLPAGTGALASIAKLPMGGLVTMVATVSGLWKGLTAFGANPANLLASVAQGNKLKDLDAQTSFRQRFAVEFRDFTTALGPKRPLVIFIDDLDRCLSENVRQVLEAVNFLVTSGDCFVILGIDRDQVQRAIGLSFKDVAEETAFVANETTASGVDKEAASRAKRAEFAQKYLQKLINLEVRVPVALDDATKRRLFERREEEIVPARERWLRTGVRCSRWLIPAVLAALILVGTVQLSLKSVPVVTAWMKANPVGSSPPAPAPVKENPANTAAIENPPVPQTAARAGMIVRPTVEAPLPVIPAPKPTWPASWVLSLPFYLVGIALLLAANVVLTTRPGVVTRDSKQFTDALDKAWYALILAKQNTPRSAKRFVNRVRYLAMRQRAYQDDAPWWDRALFPQRLREPARTSEWKPIPEPLLVALAAIEQMESPWIYENDAFKVIVEQNFQALGEKFPAGTSMAVTLLDTARSEHKKAFPDEVCVTTKADWASLPLYHNTFVAIWPRSDNAEPRGK